MTNKEEFLKGFDEDFTGVEVFISMPNCPESEMIRNPKTNFKAKKAYYEKAYDDELKLKTFPEIKITGWRFI